MLYVKHSTPSGMPVFENKIGRLEEILFLPIWINHPTPPIVALSYHWWLDWDKLFNTPPQYASTQLSAFTGWIIFEKMFKKNYFYLFLCKDLSHYYGPPYPWESWLKKNLNLVFLMIRPPIFNFCLAKWLLKKCQQFLTKILITLLVN